MGEFHQNPRENLLYFSPFIKNTFILTCTFQQRLVLNIFVFVAEDSDAQILQESYCFFSELKKIDTKIQIKFSIKKGENCLEILVNNISETFPRAGEMNEDFSSVDMLMTSVGCWCCVCWLLNTNTDKRVTEIAVKPGLNGLKSSNVSLELSPVSGFPFGFRWISFAFRIPAY